MAAVRIEDQMWSDPRFRLLAGRIGVDLPSAMMRMASVLSACIDRGTHVLSVAVVVAAFDFDGGLMSRSRAGHLGSPKWAQWARTVANALVECELAQWVDEDSLRMRGTRHGGR